MALQTSGAISLNDVNVELGNSGTASINMGSSDVRGLFGVASGAISMSDGYGASNGAVFGDRAIIFGGRSRNNNTWWSHIQYFNIASTGNGSVFGSMASPYTDRPFATTNGSRALVATLSVIKYNTIATTGNSTSFGSLTNSRGHGEAVTDGSRGVFITGALIASPYTRYDTMEYVTIATTGNSSTFGTYSSIGSWGIAGTQSSAGRGVIGSGYPDGASAADTGLYYITIATTGNTSTFGNLPSAVFRMAACSDGSRGLFGGGYSGGVYTNMDYITIATTANSSSFGSMNTQKDDAMATSNSTRAVWIGGKNQYGTANGQIFYNTIATTGNATSFGYINYTTRSARATSGN